MHEPTKDASVEDRVRHLPRYKCEFVRDLGYGKVQLPDAWLAPGDATILALDPEARLDADQNIRLKELLDRCVRLVDLIGTQIDAFVGQQKAAGTRFEKNDQESLRRGRGPSQVRDLLFKCCPAWPRSVPAELTQPIAEVLWQCLWDRQTHQAARRRDPRDLRALIEPLLSEVRQLVLEWAALKRLRSDDADWVVSEVLDQLSRTVAERNEPPENLAAWSRTTARWKWRTASTGPADVTLPPGFGAPRGDLDDEVAQRVDLERRLRAVATQLHQRAIWYATMTPPRPGDALIYRTAARLVGTGDAELVEAIVRERPEGTSVVRAELTRQAGRAAADREPTVTRVIRDTLRRYLDPEA